MKINNTLIEIIKIDITKINSDVIVNAANSTLLGGGGVDGAIHSTGGKKILQECRKLRQTLYPKGLPPGEAVITTAGDLNAKYVIHTVGPIYKNGKSNEKQTLQNCYVNCLKLAKKNNCKTIAFPAISTGVYRYPKQLAAEIAISTVIKFIDENNYFEKIIFALFNNQNLQIYKQLIKNYL